jgi:hypothetical protein
MTLSAYITCSPATLGLYSPRTPSAFSTSAKNDASPCLKFLKNSWTIAPLYNTYTEEELAGEWEERTGFPDPDTIPQTTNVLSTFTLLVVVRHWQVYFPVLANASYVSDLQAVWVVV